MEALKVPTTFSTLVNSWLPIDDFFENKNGCLVLIQGTGEVLAGYFGSITRGSIWARYCCVNESLDVGSVIPYILWAVSQGYSALVMNPNLSRNPKTRVSRAKA